MKKQYGAEKEVLIKEKEDLVKEKDSEMKSLIEAKQSEINDLKALQEEQME